MWLPKPQNSKTLPYHKQNISLRSDWSANLVPNKWTSSYTSNKMCLVLLIHHWTDLSEVLDRNMQVSHTCINVPCMFKYLPQLRVNKQMKELQISKHKHKTCSTNIHVCAFKLLRTWSLTILQEKPKATLHIFIVIDYSLPCKSFNIKIFYLLCYYNIINNIFPSIEFEHSHLFFETGSWYLCHMHCWFQDHA